MGICINYSGKLKKATDLKSLIDEVSDIAKVENWKHTVFEDAFENNTFSDPIDAENLYGIAISPPNCEPLCISFLSNGKMCGLMNFQMLDLQNSPNEDLVYSVSSKTQYAGYEIHKKLILLLEYISKKYLEDFECIDEGNFWQTKDDDLLKKTFEQYTAFIDGFSSSLEMIPKNETESLEDYLVRIAATTIENEANTDDFPKLSIEEENEFKKMKLSLEHDAVFPDNPNMKLPPEIEKQFLDSIYGFKDKLKNAKTITVFEKIGKPTFIPATLLNDEEIKIELERIEDLLYENDLILDVTCEYENYDRLIYTFITEELFDYEFEDIDIPEFFTHFHYEEFHPNDEYDIENDCIDFLTMYFNKKSKMYDEYHYTDAKNHEELNNFRTIFKKFKIKAYQFGTISIEDDTAKATFSIEFWGKIKGTDTKIYFSGKGDITFKHEFGYWQVQQVNLPLKKN
jgi:hypothetical protein